MSKMASGTMLYRFDELPVVVDKQHEYFFDGAVWLTYNAHYDSMTGLLDVDYRWDDIKQLHIPDREDLEDLVKEERVQSAVLRALDEEHYRIKEKIIDDVRSW